MLTPYLKNLIKGTYFYSDPEVESLSSVFGYVIPVHEFITEATRLHPYRRLSHLLGDLESYFPLYTKSQLTNTAGTLSLELTGTSSKKYLGITFILTSTGYRLLGVREHKQLGTVGETIRESSFSS